MRQPMLNSWALSIEEEWHWHRYLDARDAMPSGAAREAARVVIWDQAANDIGPSALGVRCADQALPEMVGEAASLL